MKKIISALLIVSILLSLAACKDAGGGAEGNQSGGQESQSEQMESNNSEDISSEEGAGNESELSENANDKKEFTISDFDGSWQSEDGEIFTIEYIDDSTLVVSYGEVSETVYLDNSNAGYLFINSDRGNTIKDDNMYRMQILVNTGELSLDMQVMGEYSIPINKFTKKYARI